MILLRPSGRWRKFNDESQSPLESWIDTLFPLDGDDSNAVIRLDLLKQIINLLICIAIVAVFDFGAFSKQRIRFIKEEDRVMRCGRRKDLPQILFCLADILADNLV